MDESAKAASISEFERKIYPIWRGVEERDKKAEDKLSGEEINAMDVLLECSTLHRQDIAIYESGMKPNRQSVEQSVMADMRRRAARASG